MKNKIKEHNALIIFISLTLVPIYLLIAIQKREIFIPSLPGMNGLRNIQLIPMALIATVLVIVLIKIHNQISNKWLFWIALGWNLFLAIFFFFETYYYWGDHY